MGCSLVLDTPGLLVLDADCPITKTMRPGEIQGVDRFEVLLVRSGCFTFRDARGYAFVDPTTCVLSSPRQLADIAHPALGGDTYLHLLLSREMWHELTLDDHAPLAARVSGQMQVAARAVLAAGSDAVDDMAVEEQALNLVAAAVANVEPTRISSGRPSTSRQRRQVVEDARAVLTEDLATTSVRDVAHRVGCSPSHLSRLFHEGTGMTMAGYRTRLRVNLALQLLADGGVTTAEAAAHSGFADQAHLTRALRHHTGWTTRGLRRLGVGSNRLP